MTAFFPWVFTFSQSSLSLLDIFTLPSFFCNCFGINKGKFKSVVPGFGFVSYLLSDAFCW